MKKASEFKATKLEAAATDACPLPPSMNYATTDMTSFIDGQFFNWRELEDRRENWVAVILLLIGLVGLGLVLLRRKQGTNKMARSSSLHVLCHEQHKSLQAAQEKIAKLEVDLKARSGQLATNMTTHIVQPRSPERQVEPRGVANGCDIDDTDDDHDDSTEQQQLLTQVHDLTHQLREKDSKLEAVQLLLYLKEKSQQEAQKIHAKNLELLEQATAELESARQQQRDREQHMTATNDTVAELLKEKEEIASQLVELEQQNEALYAKFVQAHNDLTKSKEDRELDLQASKTTQEEMEKKAAQSLAELKRQKLALASELEQVRIVSRAQQVEFEQDAAKSVAEFEHQKAALVQELEHSKANSQAKQDELEQMLANATKDFETQQRQLQNQLEKRNSCLKQQTCELKRSKDETNAIQLDLGEQLAKEAELRKSAERKIEEVSSEKEKVATELEQARQENSRTREDLHQQVLEKSDMISMLQANLDALSSDKQKLGVKLEQMRQEIKQTREERKKEVDEKANTITSLQSRLRVLEAAKETLSKEPASTAPPSDNAGELDHLQAQLITSEETRLAEIEHLRMVKERLAGETKKRQELESKMEQIEKEKHQLMNETKNVHSFNQENQRLLEKVERLEIENTAMSEKKRQLKEEYNRMKEFHAEMIFKEKDREKHLRDLEKRLENESARKSELQSKLESLDRNNRKMTTELEELKSWRDRSDEQTTDRSVPNACENKDVGKLRRDIAELAAALKASKESEATLLSERERLVANATNMSLLFAENRAKVDFLQLQLDEVKQNSHHGSSLHGGSSFLADSTEQGGGEGLSGSIRGVPASARGIGGKARFRTFLQNRVFRDSNTSSEPDEDDDETA